MNGKAASLTDQVSPPTASRDVELLLVAVSLDSAFASSTVWTVAGRFISAAVTRVD